jgi:VWFA-related protein
MTMTLRIAAVVAAAILAQGGAPARVEILSPLPDVYVSGPSTIVATVSSSDAPRRVVFFVDGRRTCILEAAPFECTWDAGRTVVEHQIRVVVEFADERRVVQTVRTRGLGFSERVNVDVVQVTVTVTDGRGRYVTGLPPEAFHVFEDGQPQIVSHFAAEDVPLELIVAVDISGSMAPAMPRLKKAVTELLTAVPSRDRVTLVGFNDNIYTLTRRTTDLADRIRAVDELTAWGATALFDVILRGAEMLGRQTGRRALIVFTDGEDQGSHATIRDVERRLQTSDVTLYMIGQGRGVELDALRKIMLRLTEPTGGRALFTDNIDQLHDAFGELLDELSNQYLLGYESTDQNRDARFRKISVEVDGHPQARARQGYRLSSGRE